MIIMAFKQLCIILTRLQHGTIIVEMIRVQIMVRIYVSLYSYCKLTSIVENCDEWIILSRGFGEEGGFHKLQPNKLYPHQLHSFYHKLVQTFYQISSSDISYLKSSIARTLLNTTPGKPQLCTKCLFVAHQFREFMSPNENCQYQTQGSQSQCLGGEYCRLYQCIRADGMDFFNAYTLIDPSHCSARVRPTSTDIYTTKRNIQVADIIIPYARIQSAAEFQKYYDDPHEYVKFRYYIGSGPWRPFNSGVNETISDSTVLCIEAWSTCGLVYQTQYTLHPGAAPSI